MSDIVMIRTFEQDIIERFAAQLARAGDQRPDQRIPPLPDPGRHLHLHRASRLHQRQDGGVDRRLQQRAATPGCRRRRCSDFNVHVSTPPGYEVEPERAGLYGDDHYEEFADPMEAARGADLVTTDVWTSMGFEAENEERMHDFADWQVDADMMRVAEPGCAVHALPARAPRRGSRGRGHRRAAIAWCGTRPRTGCTYRRR